MVKRSKKNLVGGLGARYGKRIRSRVAEKEVELRTKHYCQKCGFKAVTRISVGVWRCRKCGFTFAGGAYSPISELGETAKRGLKKSLTQV